MAADRSDPPTTSGERVPDKIAGLLARMTLAEKIGQLAMLSGDYAATGPTLSPDYLDAVRAGRAGSLLNLWGRDTIREVQRVAVEESRLGIPLVFGLDVLHGHRTILPIPLAEAGSFDPDRWERTARRAAEEATADGVALTFAPMLDVARDPRWGRMAESPGEDPWLAAAYAAAKVRGFQGDDPARPDALSATAKHFAAYGAVTGGREYASAEVSERTLHEVHLPAFAAAVRAGVDAVMPSLGDLGGTPLHADRRLLRDLLRRRWGFAGVVISDHSALSDLLAHGVAGDLAEAAALALKAGVDIDMMGRAYELGLPDALQRGLVAEREIDAAVRRVLRWKRRLGLFDDPYRGLDTLPRSHRGLDRPLAREAAVRSMVLLKNDGDLLPLPASARRIAVIGPLAAAGDQLYGPWWAAGQTEAAVSYLDGLAAGLPDREIRHAAGCGLEDCDEQSIAEARELARDADLVVLCLGEPAEISGEAASRVDPGLPRAQRLLAAAVLDTGVPTVLVLTCGRPLLERELLARVPAVLVAWFPGVEGGNALVDLLSGRHAPSARLTVSWPVDRGQIPVFFGQRPTGRPALDPDNRFVSRYVDCPNAPLYPFGHGLTYTRFAYADPSATPAVAGPDDLVEVTVEVANLGDRAGEETALLFLHDPVASSARPLLELRSFRKVTLAAGATATVRFTLGPEDFLLPGPDLKPVREPGRVEILVGPAADRDRLLSTWIELRNN